MNALLLIIIISFEVEKLCMLSDPARIIPFMCMNLCPKNIQGRVEREATEDDKSHYLSLLMLLPVWKIIIPRFNSIIFLPIEGFWCVKKHIDVGLMLC